MATSSKRLFTFILFFCLSIPFATVARAGDTVFQFSTIDALLAGLYDGEMSLQDLKYQGDFGLGTLNGLDGELVLQIGRASCRERV